MRRTLTGDLRALEAGRDAAAGRGVWRLSTGDSAGPDIYLTGVDAPAAQALRGAQCGAVDLEWLEVGVRLTLHCSSGTRVVQTRGAILHEPLPHLYEALPLQHLDAAARRFWRQVFRLVRMPGGRYLLKFIAHRARAPK